MQTLPDIRTDRQRLKEKRHAAVVRDFKHYRELMPEVKPARIIAILVTSHKYTRETLYSILKDAQLI